MSAYGLMPLMRDYSRDMSYAGSVRTAYFSSRPDFYHPHISNNGEDAIGVGATFQMGWEMGSCTPKQLAFFKSFESISAAEGIIPYEITHILVDGIGLIPFKLKLITARPYSILNLPNLETIYGHYTRKATSFEDPRTAIFMSCFQREASLGADLGLIKQVEGAMYERPYLRRLCYDTLCWGTIEAELSEISGIMRRIGAGHHTDGHTAHSLGVAIAPIDVNPRITLPFSAEGPSDPRGRWSPNGQLISLDYGKPFENTSGFSSINGTTTPQLRSILEDVEKLPYTEFELDIKCDALGNIFNVDPVWFVDRYHHLRPKRIADVTLDATQLSRKIALPLVNAFWNHRKVIRGYADLEWTKTTFVIKLMRNIHDEVVAHYFVNNEYDPEVELYFDVPLASLTSYGISEAFRYEQPEHVTMRDGVGWYGPLAGMEV